MQKIPYLFSATPHPNAIHINPLDIKFFQPVIDFSEYDYLILTSKQAVKALSAYKKEEYIHLKALCISEATAKSFEAIGGEILCVGSGYGDDLSLKLEEYTKETQWLYLRAEEVASDFVLTSREAGYTIAQEVLYASSCSKMIRDVEIEDAEATLIFTSPSSVRCFLKYHTISDVSSVIVIGKTTAKALPKGIKYKIAEDKTIQSCIKMAQ